MSEEKDKQAQEFIQQKIKGIKPVGASSVAKHPLFYKILEKIALGETPDQVGKWVGSQGHGKLRTSAIEQYLQTHLPNLYNPAELLNQEINRITIDGIYELEAMYADVCEREKKIKETLESKGLNWGRVLKEVQDEKLKILDSLNNARSEFRKLQAQENAMKDKTPEAGPKVKKWTPEFARVVSELITRNLSTSKGKLRGYQPEIIEDGE